MSDPSENLPRRFGPYVLVDRIGEGGMARIYLGRMETPAEKLLVVKQMLPLFSSTTRFSKLLIEEAKLAAQLTNNSIVQVFDLGRVEDVLYIAMEYVEGFDLRQLLQQCSKRSVALPVEFSLFIVSEVLRALDYAHRKRSEAGEPLGIVHRDVSPSNVLLSFHGEVKLCDFGIARAMAARDEVPEEAIEGKAGYMSPEAARGEQLDARADVFSAGIVLWELLAGRKLYRGGPGQPPSLEQARRAEIPELVDRGLPEQERLYAIVRQALSVELDQRYASCKDMRKDLEAYLQEVGLVTSQLRFGEWLAANFGSEIIELRRERERAALAWSSANPRQASVPAPAPRLPSAPRVPAGMTAASHSGAGTRGLGMLALVLVLVVAVVVLYQFLV